MGNSPATRRLHGRNGTMKSIYHAIKQRFDDLGNDIAQGISNSDWNRVARGIGIILFMIAITASICLLILMGAWKFLHSFWGKKLLTVIGGALLICLLYASYRANKGDSLKKVSQTAENLQLEVWAEDVYECVRDAIFLVLRSLSEHTEIVMPTSPGTVELPNRISVKDGYVVFNFFAKVRTPVDSVRIKQELNRTLSQLARAHELNGIPSELVLIKGTYYCPLLIMDVLDFGDSINMAVAFADERTVEIAKTRKQLNSGRLREMNLQGHNVPYDDQL